MYDSLFYSPYFVGDIFSLNASWQASDKGSERYEMTISFSIYRINIKNNRNTTNLHKNTKHKLDAGLYK